MRTRNLKVVGDVHPHHLQISAYFPTKTEEPILITKEFRIVLNSTLFNQGFLE
jgi:hypothetical protein